SVITFVSTVYLVELGVSMGWRIVPLGAPAQIDGKPTVAAWIEVSEKALTSVRRVTGVERQLLPLNQPIITRRNSQTTSLPGLR
ncbi:MAG: hypothetical protein L0H19_07440, partial [Salinisphaera sp.]|nr:hypothetical protein [Salinisphaera sp.]